jgi:hypothetical protein
MIDRQWVQLARYQPSKFKPNLGEAWFERDYLAATDGHRLHLATGFPKIDGVRYVDDRDEQPPSLEAVLAEADRAPLQTTWGLNKKDLAALRWLASKKEVVWVTLWVDPDRSVRLTAAGEESGFELKMRCGTGLKLELYQNPTDFSKTVRADYLWDALSCLKPTTVWTPTVKVHFDPNKGGLVLKNEARTAIIMPKV